MANRLLCSLFSLVLGLWLFLGFAAVTQAAAPVEYVERSWTGTQVVEDQNECTNYNVVNADTEEISGWYVVNSNVESSKRMVVKDTANIILCDGKELHLEDGINVPSGKTLNIYCQSAGSGKLLCDADTNDNAAIGANDEEGDCGTVNIYGGIVTADTGTKGTNGAGIGGGDVGCGGNVTIYGGTVTATGGQYGAGIGGGKRLENKGGNGGTTVIYGGKITAQGGEKAAGIGGGDGGNSGNITISGGTINATGGSVSYDGGAGIGGGNDAGANDIVINGGNITAQSSCDGAGIGGGDGGDGGTVTINNGTVTATGGQYGAGIGGGQGKGGGTININDGNVTATGGNNGAGIGGGEGGSGGIINVKGGTVTATGGSDSAGIGGGSSAASGTIKVTDGEVDTAGGPGGAGIGSGALCDKTENAVNVTIDGGNVTATSGETYSDHPQYIVAAGATIGAGGLGYNVQNEKENVVKPSYFAGSIVFNGGDVLTYEQSSAIGTSKGNGLAGVTGKVEFNGANVTKDSSLSSDPPSPMLRASEVVLKENDTLHQSVSCYSDDPAGTAETALKDDRINYLRTKECLYVVVESCTHKDSILVNNGDDHSRNCKYCAMSNTEAHSYSDFKWTLSDNGAKATRTGKCECGAQKQSSLTISAEGGTYDGSTAYGATVTDKDNIRGEAKVNYYKANENDTRGDALVPITEAPKNQGKYWAEITLGSGENTVTAHVIYTIAKPEPKPDPTPSPSLTPTPSPTPTPDSGTSQKTDSKKDSKTNPKSDKKDSRTNTKPEPKPERKPAKISGTLMAKLTAKGKNKLAVVWNKIEGAEGYDIFFAISGKKAKLAKSIRGNNTFKWSKSGLKKGTSYMANVKAYVMKSGKKNYVSKSPVVHAYTGNGNKKYSNAKSVKVNKGKVILKKGKTFRIKAKVTKVSKNKNLVPKKYAPALRFLSTNKKIATVNKSGKIKAAGKGTCCVYAYAHNGASKKITVTVK